MRKSKKVKNEQRERKVKGCQEKIPVKVRQPLLDSDLSEVAGFCFQERGSLREHTPKTAEENI